MTLQIWLNILQGKKKLKKKKIDFFKNEIKSLKKSKRCDLRKRFKISQKKFGGAGERIPNYVLFWNWPTQILSTEHFQLQWYSGKEIDFFLKMKWFFTNIYWLVCRVVTIVLLTQRTRLGEPFRYLEHVRTVHSKFSRGVWKKVSA